MTTALVVRDYLHSTELTETFWRLVAGINQVITGAPATPPPLVSQSSWFTSLDAPTGAAISVKDWVSDVALNPDDVRRLCGNPLAANFARQAVELAKLDFPPRSRVVLRTEQDAESDAEWLVVDVEANEGVAEVMRSYNAFVSRWIRQVPPSARDLVHLTFHFV